MNFEGIWYWTNNKPRLTPNTIKRNKRVCATSEIKLIQQTNIEEYEYTEEHEDKEILYGQLTHIIHPGCSGFVVEFPEDFDLHRIDVAYVKQHICERDEIFVIFEMHVLAKVQGERIKIFLI